MGNSKEEPIRIAHIVGKWLGGGVEAVVQHYCMVKHNMML